MPHGIHLLYQAGSHALPLRHLRIGSVASAAAHRGLLAGVVIAGALTLGGIGGWFAHDSNPLARLQNTKAPAVFAPLNLSADLPILVKLPPKSLLGPYGLM